MIVWIVLLAIVWSLFVVLLTLVVVGHAARVRRNERRARRRPGYIEQEPGCFLGREVGP